MSRYRHWKWKHLNAVGSPIWARMLFQYKIREKIFHILEIWFYFSAHNTIETRTCPFEIGFSTRFGPTGTRKNWFHTMQMYVYGILYTVIKKSEELLDRRSCDLNFRFLIFRSSLKSPPKWKEISANLHEKCCISLALVMFSE